MHLWISTLPIYFCPEEYYLFAWPTHCNDIHSKFRKKINSSYKNSVIILETVEQLFPAKFIFSFHSTIFWEGFFWGGGGSEP